MPDPSDPQPHAPSPSDGWRPWARAPFAEAQARGCPVLLWIGAAWSGASQHFAAHGGAAATDLLRREGLVGIRVDADERPDIADRYTLGGWPTLAVLTPEGAVLAAAGGGSPAEVERWVREVLARYGADAARLRQAGVSQILQRRPGPGGQAPDEGAPEAALSAFLERQHDGGEPLARLLVDGWLLTLGAAAGDAGLRRQVGEALDATLDDSLRDARTGALRRTVEPGRAGEDALPLLELQAGAARVFAAAAHTLGEPRFGERAREALVVAHQHLPSDRGGWRLSTSPADVARVLVEANARAVQAHLHAAAALDAASLAERAVDALERLVAQAYRPGAGMAHVIDPTPRVMGLLGDQVAMAEALLDAGELTGRAAYPDLALELMRSAARRLWDEAAGAFRDRVTSPAGAGDVGLLGQPAWPLDLNCAAARVLARLAARADGDASLRAMADRILATFGDAWRDHLADAVAYGLAVAEVGR